MRDEVTVAVADESDLAYTAGVFREIARTVVGPEMGAAADRSGDLWDETGAR